MTAAHEALYYGVEAAGTACVDSSIAIRSLLRRRLEEGSERIRWIRQVQEALGQEERILDEERRQCDFLISLTNRREEAGRNAVQAVNGPLKGSRQLLTDLRDVMTHVENVNQRLVALKATATAAEERKSSALDKIALVQKAGDDLNDNEAELDAARRTLKAREFELQDRRKAVTRSESNIAVWSETLANRESVSSNKIVEIQRRIAALRDHLGKNGVAVIPAAPRQPHLEIDLEEP